jgi:hypothetical protein
MSQENIELVHRALDAFNRRDFDSFLALVDEEVEFAAPRTRDRKRRSDGADGLADHAVASWTGHLVAHIPERDRGASCRRPVGVGAKGATRSREVRGGERHHFRPLGRDEPRRYPLSPTVFGCFFVPLSPPTGHAFEGNETGADHAPTVPSSHRGGTPKPSATRRPRPRSSRCP